MLTEIDETVKYLQSKMEPDTYTRVNDLVGCFIDIYDSVESGDLEYANYKLFTYFEDEHLFAGNVSADGYDVYLSAYDKEQGAVEYYLGKAIELVMREY